MICADFDKYVWKASSTGLGLLLGKEGCIALCGLPHYLAAGP